MKPLSFLMALVLFSLGWKKGVMHIHLALLSRSKIFLGPRFLFQWYRCLAFDLLTLLSGKPLPIRVRPVDRKKFELLRTRPTLFLTAHFHNWEALAGWMVRQGIPLLGAARPLSSPVFHSWLSSLRKRRGIPVTTEGILSSALSHLRAGHCFGILWDQYSPLHRHSSPLFGLPAAMDPLPEILVRRVRPAVIAGFLLPDGALRLIPLLPSDSPHFDPARLSRRYHRVLETVVRSYPTYWYGLCHARYKDTISYPGKRRASPGETPLISLSPKSKVSRETSLSHPTPR